MPADVGMTSKKETSNERSNELIQSAGAGAAV